MLGHAVRLSTLNQERARIGEAECCVGKINFRDGCHTFTRHSGVEGHVTLKILRKTMTFTGLWIQIEGVAISSFRHEDGAGSIFNLFADRCGSVDGSGILDLQLLGRNAFSSLTGEEPSFYPLDPGVHTLHFKLRLDDRELPASFSSRFGEIYYKIVLRFEAVCNGIRENDWLYWEKLLDEKIVRTRGYRNLSHEPISLNEPITVVRKRGGSFFSKRAFVQVTLALTKHGYLPAEKLLGLITIENPAGRRIRELSVSFLQKIIYYDHCVRKATTTTLREFRKTVDCRNEGIQEELSLQLPFNLMPTWRRGKNAIEIFYCLLFLVKIENMDEIRGDTEIVIGSCTDDSGDSAANTLEFLATTGSPSRSAGLRRASFPSSNLPSRVTPDILPPTYSCLSSRRSSLASLPPAYTSLHISEQNVGRYCSEDCS